MQQLYTIKSRRTVIRQKVRQLWLKFNDYIEGNYCHDFSNFWLPIPAWTIRVLCNIKAFRHDACNLFVCSLLKSTSHLILLKVERDHYSTHSTLCFLWCAQFQSALYLLTTFCVITIQFFSKPTRWLK